MINYEEIEELIKDIRQQAFDLSSIKLSKNKKYKNCIGILLCTDALISILHLDKEKITVGENK
jgi:hypothetical protein